MIQEIPLSMPLELPCAFALHQTSPSFRQAEVCLQMDASSQRALVSTSSRVLLTKT